MVLKPDRKIPKVSGQREGDPAELAEPGFVAVFCGVQAAGSTVTRKPIAESWAMWLRSRRSMLMRLAW